MCTRPPWTFNVFHVRNFLISAQELCIIAKENLTHPLLQSCSVQNLPKIEMAHIFLKFVNKPSSILIFIIHMRCGLISFYSDFSLRGWIGRGGPTRGSSCLNESAQSTLIKSPEFRTLRWRYTFAHKTLIHFSANYFLCMCIDVVHLYDKGAAPHTILTVRKTI